MSPAHGCVLLALVAAIVQDEAGVPRAATAAPPEDLVAMLDEFRLAQEEGATEEARALLQAVFDEGIFDALLEEPEPVLLAGLDALDDCADDAHSVSALLRVREERVGILAQSLDEEDSERLAAEVALASAREDAEDLQGAKELKEHVLAVRRRILPPDDPLLLEAEANLAVTCYYLQDYERALALTEDAHAGYSRQLPADDPTLLMVKGNLAALRARLGDSVSALKIEEEIFAVRQRTLPADHPDLLMAMGNLAASRFHTGDIEGSRILREHVHAALSRMLPADHPDLLRAKGNLALTRNALGDHEGALALAEFVYEEQSSRLPPDHPYVLLAMGNLAQILWNAGEMERGLELAERAHDIRARKLPPDHQDMILSKGNVAAMRAELGDVERALPLQEENLAAWERRTTPSTYGLLWAREQLANTLWASGRRERALELLGSVHAARADRMPPDHVELLDTTVRLASWTHRSGDFEGAYRLIREFLEGQRLRVGTFAFDAPRQARAFAMKALWKLPVALQLSQLAAEEGVEDLDPEIFALLESLRISVTSSPRFAHIVDGSPELVELRRRVAASRREQNDLAFSFPEAPAELEEWRRRFDACSEERDRLEKELRQGIAAAGEVLVVSAEALAPRLESDSAFVGYLRTFDTSGSGALLAFVVTPDAAVRRVELGSSSEIEQLASRWRQSVGRPVESARGARGIGEETDPPSAGSLDERELGAELRARILDPCLEATGEREVATIHVVLDDFLHLIPIDALPAVDGGRIGEGLEVRVETSAERLLAPTSSTTGGTLVAIGGVDFDGETSLAPESTAASPPVATRSGAGHRFPPLAGTLPEVEFLSELYARDREDEPILVRGKDASKERLRALASQAKYLHVATHGWFASEFYASALDAESPDTEASPFQRARRAITGFAPETLCGLALTGANRGANRAGRVPGIITAEELATLDLSNCDLAVLSACETNVGIRRAGQGIQSLQSALHAAGARTAITSLWRVDDAATRRLMELFYSNLWNEGLGKAESLWRAKMSLRDAGHPIRDWAGWVLTGDPD